jgi:hypothetical protein
MEASQETAVAVRDWKFDINGGFGGSKRGRLAKRRATEVARKALRARLARSLRLLLEEARSEPG